jgi:hypothetical protein
MGGLYRLRGRKADGLSLYVSPKQWPPPIDLHDAKTQNIVFIMIIILTVVKISNLTQ